MAPAELTEHQLRAIEITERVCSVASLIGTGFIISTFLLDKNFHRPINRLVFYASFGNIMANVGTLISRSGITSGVNGGLCQFQGFLIQMFLPADALWTLAMACNVYLTFFHKYSAQQLRALEWKYFVFCYSLPFIPAFVYFFINVDGKGKMYGSATLWCWVSVKWDIMRVAVFYGPVWVVIAITFGIYFWAGKEIFEKRRQLREFPNCQSDPGASIQNPFTAPFASTKTTEIHITSELADLRANNSSQVSLKSNSDTKIKGASGFDPYSVTIETNTRPVSPPPLTKQTTNTDTNLRQRSAANEANRAAFNYCKCAMLFFLSLLVTWVPSTVNRVYSLVHPDLVSFGLNYVSAFVLPLQGFWNAIVYIVTSHAACKELYLRLASRPRPSIRIPSPHQVISFKSSIKDSFGGRSGSESCSDSMKGLAQA